MTDLEGAWTSIEDPGERAIVRGKRYEIYRRAWLGGVARWVLVQWDDCTSERAASWIVRCRGHLPPCEPAPSPDLGAALLRARAAEERVDALTLELVEAAREIAALRAALDRRPDLD